MRSYATPAGGSVGSRDADIDFTFTDPITVRAVLDALVRVGWSMDVSLGGLSYMIDDADGMFEWYSNSPADADEVLARLDAPGNLPYSVAVDVYHPEAGTGGMLLFVPGRTEVSFVPTIDRRRIPAAPEFTDLAWYLNALVPAFVGVGLEGYEAKEIKY
ncbi:hypothetical protein ACF1BA_08220 [Streptomyces rubiginosohelvolus]|uniref:hypothetical protein n=1 Tax=Streptomyces rubiginosohelvolus TaxID=67362 RepID=UPI0037010838